MNNAVYIPVKHDDDYWMHDTPLFIGKFPYYRNEPRMVQGKLFVSEEHFYNRLVSEIIPLSSKEGKRQYVHMKPYVLEPQMLINVLMYPQPKQYADKSEAHGKVVSSELKGLRQHEIGNAQAWYSPAEKTIVLWECFLWDFRTHPLAEDPHMKQLWSSFEHWLINQFPNATRIATPFHDPIAETREEYQTFLRSLGYHPSTTAQAAFEKPIQPYD